MSNRQARRQPPRTGKRLGLPKTCLRALAGHPLLAVTARNLRLDATALEMHVHRQDKRSQSIIRQLRRLASFYQQVTEERDGTENG